VVLEHDMVFLRAWEPVATPGVLTGNGDWEYLSQWPHLTPAWRDRHCKRPDLLGGAGVPFIVTAADLATIHDGLAERTAAIRADEQGDRDPWVAEMYAVVFAAADAGLVSDVGWQAKHFAHEHPSGDLPVLHYGWPYTHPDGWHFHKHTYRPWTDPGPAPADAPRSVLDLSAVLQGFLAAYRDGHVHSGVPVRVPG
jgi:hypothetical protein